MNFDFTNDQIMLRDLVRKWVSKSYNFERRKSIVQSGGFSRQAWGEMAELGLTSLQIPENHLGMGLGPVEAMVVMEELGRGLVLEPFSQGALISTALLAAHAPAILQASWLPRIGDGQALVILAHQERAARYRLSHVSTKATLQSGAWSLSGAKSVVAAGDQADAFIVPARVSGTLDDPTGIALFLVERRVAGVSTSGYATQDGARAAELSLNHAPASLLAPAGAGFAALEHAIDIGIAAICAEAVGAMDKLVELTVEYMNTRKQFGVPIASFQALRHRIADVKMQLELGRSMSYFASLMLGEPPEQRRRALAQAKLQLCDSTREVGQQCIQLHGGIGVTDDYMGSHYFKRLTMIAMSFGDSLHQLSEVSARMQDTAGVLM